MDTCSCMLRLRDVVVTSTCPQDLILVLRWYLQRHLLNTALRCNLNAVTRMVGVGLPQPVALFEEPVLRPHRYHFSETWKGSKNLEDLDHKERLLLTITNCNISKVIAAREKYEVRGAARKQVSAHLYTNPLTVCGGWCVIKKDYPTCSDISNSSNHLYL